MRGAVVETKVSIFGKRGLSALEAIDDNYKRRMSVTTDRILDRLVDQAKQNAPVRSGALQNSIQSFGHAGSFGLGGIQMSFGSELPYAPAIESGSRAHDIVAKDGGALRIPDGAGGFIFRMKVRHPGTKAQKFLERAYLSLEPWIVEEVATSFVEALSDSGALRG